MVGEGEIRPERVIGFEELGDGGQVLLPERCDSRFPWEQEDAGVVVGKHRTSLSDALGEYLLFDPELPLPGQARHAFSRDW